MSRRRANLALFAVTGAAEGALLGGVAGTIRAILEPEAASVFGWGASSSGAFALVMDGLALGSLFGLLSVMLYLLAFGLTPQHRCPYTLGVRPVHGVFAFALLAGALGGTLLAGRVLLGGGGPGSKASIAAEACVAGCEIGMGAGALLAGTGLGALLARPGPGDGTACALRAGNGTGVPWKVVKDD